MGLIDQTLSRRQALVAGGGALGALSGAALLPQMVQAGTGSALRRNASSMSSGSSPNWNAVAAALQVQGIVTGNVFVADADRTNLSVTVDGVPVLAPWALDDEFRFLALSSDEVVLSSEITLLQSEVEEVVSAVIDAGGVVMALHNHLIKMDPPIVYLHWRAKGDPVGLAKVGNSILKMTNVPLPQSPSASPETPDVQTAEDILGADAMMQDEGVFEFDFPRPETITVAGYTFPPEMAVETMIMFEPIGNGQYAVMGEFALIASEVNRVSRALREQGAWVTAIHHHETDEQPQLYFTHGFMTGDISTVANAMKKALDQQAYTSG
jgi:hypothetical protein